MQLTPSIHQDEVTISDDLVVGNVVDGIGTRTSCTSISQSIKMDTGGGYHPLD